MLRHSNECQDDMHKIDECRMKKHKQNDKKKEAMTTSSVYFDATNGIESNALGHDTDNAINSFQYTIKNVRFCSFSIQQLIPVQMHRLSFAIFIHRLPFLWRSIVRFHRYIIPCSRVLLSFKPLFSIPNLNLEFEKHSLQFACPIPVYVSCANLEIQYNLRARNENKK